MHFSQHKREEEKNSVSNSVLTRALSPDSKEELTALRTRSQKHMSAIETQACEMELNSEGTKEGEKRPNRRS